MAVRASDAFVCSASPLSADGSEHVTIRVLMIVVRALPSEPRRALTKGICGADETCLSNASQFFSA